MDVAIVGGGIVGTAAAARLARSGADVTLLERGVLGEGTTARSAAVFTWQGGNRTDLALRERAWETYESLIAEGRVGFEQVGTLSVAETEEYADGLRGAAADLREWGLDAESLDPDGVRARGIDPDPCAGGLYTSRDGYLDVEDAVARFAERALDAGADVRTYTRVTGVDVADGAVAGVETEDGRLDADVVVNAAGPWAPAVNDYAGVTAPLRHTVGPILVVEGNAHDLPFALFESKRYVRPVGGTGAFVGTYLTDYADGERVDPDEPRTVGDFRTDGRDFLADAVPALADADVVDEWVGLRTVTPDGRPIVGETDVDGFHLAVGMSGLGVTFAPVVADVLAATVHDDPDPHADVLSLGRL